MTTNPQSQSVLTAAGRNNHQPPISRPQPNSLITPDALLATSGAFSTGMQKGWALDHNHYYDNQPTMTMPSPSIGAPLASWSSIPPPTHNHGRLMHGIEAVATSGTNSTHGVRSEPYQNGAAYLLNQRLACPFQLSGHSTDCFKPSSQNREGGTFDLSRLKQHIFRKHLGRTRCTKCWSSFDTSAKFQHHTNRGRCLSRDLPNGDWFVEEEQYQRAFGAPIPRSGSAPQAVEAYWWSVLTELVPQASLCGIDLLKTVFSPYFSRNTSKLTIQSFSLQVGNHMHPATMEQNLSMELEPESQGSSVYGFASTSVHEQGFLPRDHTALPTSVPGLSAQPPSMWTVPSTCQVTYPPLNRILSLPTQSSWMGEIMQTTDST